MIPARITSARLLAAFLVVALAVTSGCGGRGGVGKGMNLEYKMPKKEALAYRSVSESLQKMSVQGMNMEVTSDKKLVFSVRTKGQEDTNYRLEVTVDSLDVNMVSMQGNFSADAASVLGKSFEMTLSALGVESDLSGASALEYEIGMAGKRSVSAEFQAVFPDLAGRPLEIGGTWTATDTLDIKEGDGDIHIILEQVNTLEGFETVEGLECARVSAVVTGTLSGTGEQGGAKLTFNGTFEGTELWHFARKKGVLVKSVSESKVMNTVKVTGPQEMEIPVSETTKSEIVLVK